jgi:hypothetical protein
MSGAANAKYPMRTAACTGRAYSALQMGRHERRKRLFRSMQRIFGIDPTHIDPTAGLAFSWLHNASTGADFSTFFALGQFP